MLNLAKQTTASPSIVEQAIAFIREAQPLFDTKLNSADSAIDLIRLRIANAHQEKFLVLFMNNQMELVHDEIMFTGTINSAAVYPREIIRRCLELGANQLIIAHNHPTGTTTPSEADKQITMRIQSACRLFDITVQDHIIVSAWNDYSFAQHGVL
jgi:DNA repair protein RadC